MTGTLEEERYQGWKCRDEGLDEERAEGGQLKAMEQNQVCWLLDLGYLASELWKNISVA